MSLALPPAIRRYAEHPFWQAIGILLLAYIVVVWVVPVLPGSAIVPKSVVLQYMVTVLVGVLIYVSDNEERWSRFKEPIQAVLIEPRLRVVRAAVLAGVTALVGLVAYGQVKTSVAAPPNLRSIHPAPPPEITFRGRTITLTGLENPLRQHPDSLPAYLAEGKRVYYQNCLPCRPGSTRSPRTSKTTARSRSLPRASCSGESRRAAPGCRARARRGTRPCRCGRTS